MILRRIGLFSYYIEAHFTILPAARILTCIRYRCLGGEQPPIKENSNSSLRLVRSLQLASRRRIGYFRSWLPSVVEREQYTIGSWTAVRRLRRPVGFSPPVARIH